MLIKKILIDIQTIEELNEINNILNKSSERAERRICISKSKIPESTKLNFKNLRKIRAKNTWLCLALLIYELIKYRPAILLTGSPALHHRLALFLSPVKPLHLIYYRGLLASPETISSKSDWLRFKLLRGLNTKLTNNYLCDELITIGNTNKNFLIQRGVPKEKIKLLSIKTRIDIKAAPKPPIKHTIIICTTAYEHHGHIAEQIEQDELISKIASEILSSTNYNIILRKHPRGTLNRIPKNILQQVIVDETTAVDFLNTTSITNTTIISPISTFAFELAALKHNVFLFSGKTMDKLAPESFSHFREKYINTSAILHCIEKEPNLKISPEDTVNIFSENDDFIETLEND